MSRDSHLHQDPQVDESNVDLDQNTLDQLVELVNSPVKHVYQDGPSTIIEFENGQTLPLQGGGLEILNYNEPKCSFCGKARSEVKALAAPPNKEEPAICPDCAIGYVELFGQHGIPIEINISKIAPKLAEQLAGLRSEISPEGEK